MNFSQKLGLFVLILISVIYVYFSFFNQNGIDFSQFNNNFTPFDEQTSEENKVPDLEFEEIAPPLSNIPDMENIEENNSVPTEEINKKPKIVNVKIFITDSKGNLRSVNRECNTQTQKSCFSYAMKELINAPSKWEKSKGFNSEIPSNTKILSIREGNGSIKIDLSSSFEAGGGTESTYVRVKQIIKTANANSNLPVYLYINGKKAEVIGGDGIMIKQPLNERSLDG